MLVDPKGLNDVYFGLMMKVVRAGGEAEFVACASKETFPKIKMGPAEQKIKEVFWKECFKALQSRGLLSPANKVA
ncbi:MAG: hypothetical protein C5B49_15245 [Bdellovibrio sp.]|nr:MAG: hypothetical protein C5B49_15245 [Bdellovibrio sp.]